MHIFLHTPDSAKLIISDVSSCTSLWAACPSKLGISNLPSSRTLPAWSLRSAVTIAALGMGWVIFGLSLICSRFNMCLLTASRRSMSIRPESSGCPSPQEAHWDSWDTVSAPRLHWTESMQAIKQVTERMEILIFLNIVSIVQQTNQFMNSYRKTIWPINRTELYFQQPPLTDVHSSSCSRSLLWDVHRKCVFYRLINTLSNNEGKR